MTDIRVAAEQARVALRLAVLQNEHDMLMTGDELRQCSAALASLEAALAAQPEQQQGQGLVHPAMSTSGRTSVQGGGNAPQVGGLDGS